MADGFQISVDVDDVRAVLAGFRKLDVSLQKKYLGAAVNAVAKSRVPAVRKITPRFNGSLRKSVGASVTRAVAKPFEAGAGGGKAVAKFGYRVGKTQKGKQFGGNAAYWIEKGVKARRPKTASKFLIGGKSLSKYPYLGAIAKPVIGTSQPGVFLPYTKPIAGKRNFEKWCKANLPSMLEELKRSLGGYLVKARNEGARRAAMRLRRRALRI